MTETTSEALPTALAYYEAWTNHDFDRAMTFIADDIVCHTPPGSRAQTHFAPSWSRSRRWSPGSP